MKHISNPITFFTASILNWYELLFNDNYKNIVINSLKYLKNSGKIFVYALVIMPNHIHFIWKINEMHTPSGVQRDLLKFTAQNFKFNLIENNQKVLDYFYVNKKDREYQFWKRNPLSIEITDKNIFFQKFNYIHYNPIQENWKLSKDINSYKYSSAKFYKTGIDEWNLFTHYKNIKEFKV